MTSGADVARNLAQCRALLRQAHARGASVAALPENFAIMGRSEADKLAISEAPGDGPIQAFLAAIAARARPVDRWQARFRCGCPKNRASRPRASSSTTAVDAWRATTRSTCSTSIFRAATERYRESATVRPGSQPRRRRHAGSAGSVSPSATTCGFPELFRELQAQGAEWFCLPSAFTAPTGRAHWEVAAARPRHRESVLRGGAGPVRLPRQRP